MDMSTHEVLGQQVAMPVEIRNSRAWSALFLVPVEPARELLAGVGLEPARALPGRAVCSLAFVDYIDGDLGPYHEFAVALLARQPGVKGSSGAYIHWLPVDGEFTCAAGQGIWGFPKEIADIAITEVGRRTRCTVELNGELAISLELAGGFRAPSGAGALAIDAYTHRDGILRRTPWGMRPAGTRMRFGGARIELGTHPIAAQLRSLGLPRTALMTSSINLLRMTFADAKQV